MWPKLKNTAVSFSVNNLPRPKEDSVHMIVAKYLKLQYPGIVFRTDFAAGIKMTMGQAVKHKKLQSEDKYPDLFIAEPRGGYHGLYLEIKRDIHELQNKNGTPKKSEHLDGQRAMLQKLNKKGYRARFAAGFDHARQLIDEYLSLPTENSLNHD